MKVLLMTGGSSSSGIDTQTEQLNLKSLKWISSFELPDAVYGHCVVSINATTILIIGGGTGASGSDQTFFVHSDGKSVVL